MKFVQKELPEVNVNVAQIKPLQEFSALLVALVIVITSTFLSVAMEVVFSSLFYRKIRA